MNINPDTEILSTSSSSDGTSSRDNPPVREKSSRYSSQSNRIGMLDYPVDGYPDPPPATSTNSVFSSPTSPAVAQRDSQQSFSTSNSAQNDIKSALSPHAPIFIPSSGYASQPSDDHAYDQSFSQPTTNNTQSAVSQLSPHAVEFTPITWSSTQRSPLDDVADSFFPPSVSNHPPPSSFKVMSFNMGGQSPLKLKESVDAIHKHQVDIAFLLSGRS